MKEPTDAQLSIRRHRGWRLLFGLNTLAATLLLGLLLLMANYLSYRHFARWDLSRTRFYSLSAKTQQLLAGLTNRVDVIAFLAADNPLYRDIQSLLKEYRYHTRQLHVEWVDPLRNLARAEDLAGQYEVDKPNAVIFAAQGRKKIVTMDDMADYAVNPVDPAQGSMLKAFKGEQAFSSAIHAVTQDRQPIVYTLRGHGEEDLDDHDPRTGYSILGREMRHDNIEIRPFQFGEQAAIPKDCDLLLLLAPAKKFSQEELSRIDQYLEQNGRLLALIDSFSETGLEPLLEKWGLRLGQDMVLDKTRTLSGHEIFITRFEPHPITDRLRGITSILYMPRSVEPLALPEDAANPADRPRAWPLAVTSPQGWAESDIQATAFDFDPARDRPGPVTLAAAAERGPIQGMDVRLRPTRLVVVGDSGFVSNAAMTGGDLDLFMSALNWLLERQSLMAIAPKPLEVIKLMMDTVELRAIFALAAGGIPLLVGLAGLLVWARRRR